jgi:hypothetical protein
MLEDTATATERRIHDGPPPSLWLKVDRQLEHAFDRELSGNREASIDSQHLVGDRARGGRCEKQDRSAYIPRLAKSQRRSPPCRSFCRRSFGTYRARCRDAARQDGIDRDPMLYELERAGTAECEQCSFGGGVSGEAFDDGPYQGR